MTDQPPIVFDLPEDKNWFNSDNFLVFFDWCNDRFGMREPRDHEFRWDVKGHWPIRVYFRDYQDARWFKLEWL
jgi:hypothetical protein